MIELVAPEYKQVAPGYKQTKVGIIPADWEVVKISTLFTKVSAPVIVDINQNYQEIGIRSHGKGIFYKEKISGKKLGNKLVFGIKPDCLILNIVFAWEQAITKTTHKEIGMIASHRFPMYQPNPTCANVDYFLYFFKSKRGKAFLELASPGGAGRNKTLGQGEFAHLELPTPPIVEQEKIATILATWDDAIAKQTQLIEHKQLFKKGLLQQIFSQKLRFKDSNGNPYPTWQPDKFANLFYIYNASPFSRAQLNYSDGDIHSIHYGDIHTKFNGFIDMNTSTLPVINKNISIAKKYNYCMDGDLILADASEDYKDIGKAVELINVNDHKILAGLHTILVRERSKFAQGFKAYLLQSAETRKQLEKIANGISVLGISKANLANIVLTFPELEEQKKIADLLMSIDNELAKQAEVFEQLNLQKQTLMHLLLSGQVRVWR